MIEVADPILRHTQVLTVAELDAVARDFGINHAVVITARREPEQKAVSQPIKAPSAAPVQPSSDQELGLADLFFSADSSERRMLLMSLGSVESEEPQRVQPAATNQALEAAALGRDRAGFTKLLESALGLTHEQAERIVTDPSGEPLLIAAKALAMPSVTLQRILIFIDPAIGELVQRVFDLASLYERVSADASHKIIASLRGREPVRARRPAIARCTTTTRQRAGGADRARGVPLLPSRRRRPAPSPRRVSADVIEEVPAAAILDLDNPEVGIEAQLACQIPFDVRFRERQSLERRTEGALARARLVEHGLRRRPVEIGGAVESAHLDEDRARLFGAAPAQHRGRALDLAAAQIGGNPDIGFQAHAFPVTPGIRLGMPN